MPTAAGARNSARASASPSRNARRAGSIRKPASATPARSLARRRSLRSVETALRPLADLARRHAGPWNILAVAHLGAAVGPGEDRPVAVVIAMGSPHVEILMRGDEARLGHS